MLNTQVTFTGWIKDAHISKPEESWEDECYKYSLLLAPEDYGQLCDLEHRVYEVKKHHQELAELPAAPEVADPYINEDKIFINHCLLRFETLKKPHLMSYLDGKSDEDLHWRYVKVIGNIKIHMDGNAYMTCHLIEPMEPEKDLEEIDVSYSDNTQAEFDW